jgi:ferredoxin
MPTVRFHPSGKSKEIRKGATILFAANQLDLGVGQSCDGDGICGSCRVRILEGAERLGTPSMLEARLIQEKDFAANERAACLARVEGDVTVTTSYWAP